jgi:hypothetical protein
MAGTRGWQRNGNRAVPGGRGSSAGGWRAIWCLWYLWDGSYPPILDDNCHYLLPRSLRYYINADRPCALKRILINSSLDFDLPLDLLRVLRFFAVSSLHFDLPLDLLTCTAPHLPWRAVPGNAHRPDLFRECGASVALFASHLHWRLHRQVPAQVSRLALLALWISIFLLIFFALFASHLHWRLHRQVPAQVSRLTL